MIPALKAACAVLDKVRTRAQIPTFSEVYPGLSKSVMKELIRRQRRVETGFEGKRNFDLLRWKTAEINLNKVMHGMKITPKTGGGYNHKVVNAVPAGSSQWSFDATKNYLLPIPLSIRGKNPQPDQNPH